MAITATPSWHSDPRLARAHAHAQRSEVLQAQVLYREVLNSHPGCGPAARALAAFAMDREDFASAKALLEQASRATPGDTDVLYALAQAQWLADEPPEAIATLKNLLRGAPSHYLGWTLLGDLFEAAGNSERAIRAWYQAIKRAQESGVWLNRDSTEPAALEGVMRRIAALNRGQRALLFESFATLRDRFGSKELARVDRALTGYLGEWDATPPDPRQRPKFFYFPDLPAGPYHDPYLHTWASDLSQAWEGIRDEAAELLAQDRDFESFLGLKPGQDKKGYVGGTNPDASWDAYFFYRRGQRFDTHHLQCPKTSAVLDSIDLCRINRQAPEVCFSVIRPQSTIEPHYGVTNTRLVMHLPLIIPPGCALDIVGGPAHHWKPGELVMFDDTFQNGAWNHSDQPRLIVLMDCWNPHLTPPERQAVQMLINAVEDFEFVDAVLT